MKTILKLGVLCLIMLFFAGCSEAALELENLVELDNSVTEPSEVSEDSKATGDYIYGLTIIGGNSYNISAPSGWTKINVDLNRGAGGKFLFLCYKRTSTPTLTSIKADSCGYARSVNSIWPSNHWVVGLDGYSYSGSTVNLNSGIAWRKKIYAFISRTGYVNSAPIKGVDVIYGSSSGIYRPGWVKVNQDLNEDVGGDYIYIVYRTW